MEKRSGEKAAMASGGVAPPKKARTLRRAPAAAPAVPKKEPAGDQAAAEEPKTVDATLPLDVLECPLCFAPLDAAIFQCRNGHAACGGCRDRVRGACPFCHEPVGDIRCRPLEHAVAAMVVPCGFAAAGCPRRVWFPERRSHEALFCRHAPCACPLPGCAYAGHLLHDHIRDAHRGDGGGGAVAFFLEATVTLHRSMVFRVLLHEPDSRVFLLLNGGDVPSGRSLSLLSVGPRPAADRALEYTMVVRAGGDPGALSLSASGPVPCTRRWAGPDHLPAEGFLFVPDAYWSSSGSVSVTVQVRKLIVAPAVEASTTPA